MGRTGRPAYKMRTALSGTPMRTLRGEGIGVRARDVCPLCSIDAAGSERAEGKSFAPQAAIVVTRRGVPERALLPAPANGAPVSNRLCARRRKGLRVRWVSPQSVANGRDSRKALQKYPEMGTGQRS